MPLRQALAPAKSVFADAPIVASGSRMISDQPRPIVANGGPGEAMLQEGDSDKQNAIRGDDRANGTFRSDPATGSEIAERTS
jgi:hypothetical protein